MKNRVFIVDYEVVSPIGIGAPAMSRSLESNFSADREIKNCVTDGIPFKKAAEITDDVSRFYCDEPDILKMACAYDRKLELLVACWGKASDRLMPLVESLNESRVGVLVGVGADVTPFERFGSQLAAYTTGGLNPFHELILDMNSQSSFMNVINNPYDVHALFLGNHFKATAFHHSILTACVASTQALAFAYDAIAADFCDVAVAGGTDSLINVLALISFGKLGVITESTDEATCKPFDINRSGALAGECAGFAVLASENTVIKKGLSAVAELVGYGNTMDAYKITAPDPDGKSISRAIADAVANAGLEATQIGYINAHGTGTKQNDHTELHCIANALGPAARTIPISSTKSRHGHAIAAAGIQELCVVLECFKHNMIPGNLNMKNPCDTSFNLIRDNLNERIDYALTCNYAFGGVNTVLALKNEC